MSDDPPMEKKLPPKIFPSSKASAKFCEGPLPQSRGGRSGNYGRQVREFAPANFAVANRSPFGGGYGTPTSASPAADYQRGNNFRQDRRYQQQQRSAAPNSARNRVETVDTGPEVGSVSRPGSKKGGVVGDFLNFSYDSPVARNRNHPNHREFTYTEPARYPLARRQATVSSYNKEQYLLANCQFVVSDGFDYNAYLADPDILVDWDHIEELRLMEQDVPSCPICLYPPVAAKITRCGHVYCWPCILHYLSLSDKDWRKCPICYESVYKLHLKSVTLTKVGRFEEGEKIRLRLMRREKGSNLVLPVSTPSNWNARRGHVGKLNDGHDRFMKLLTCSAQETRTEIIERERNELNAELISVGDQPESCFIHDALNALTVREKTLASVETFREMPSNPSLYGTSPPKSLVHKKRHSDAMVFSDAFNDVSEISSVTQDVAEEISLPNKQEVTLADNEEPTAVASCNAEASANLLGADKSFYFYQADDGQHIYLHPLNARCLVHEYGSLETAPELISGVIVQTESFVTCEELRRRYRYLSHLPLTCNFNLVELKFDEGTVSDETVAEFSDEFVKRHKLRQKKARDVHRLHQQAQRWEKAVLMDPRNFVKPAFSVSDEIPITKLVPSVQQEIASGLANVNLHKDETSGETVAAGSPEDSGALSFAQMLRQGKPKPMKSTESNSSIQSSLVGGVSSSASGANIAGGPSLEDYLPAPIYKNAFEEALQSAFDSLHAKDADETMGAEKSNKKKKQKSKGKLLFSN